MKGYWDFADGLYQWFEEGQTEPIRPEQLLGHLRGQRCYVVIDQSSVSFRLLPLVQPLVNPGPPISSAPEALRWPDSY